MKMIRCLLGDIITFQRGYDLPRTKMEPGEYPVVGSNGIIGYHNQYTTEAPCITIGRSGNVGGPQIQFGRAWAHNTTLFVKEFKNVDPVFVYYLLLTLDLGNYAGGSAVPTLNRNHIHSLPITIPAEIETQKRIARILSSLDDKIEVNNQINRNLEEQAKAIFKSWFVDFEPFGGEPPDDWKTISFSSFLRPRREKSSAPSIPLFAVTNTGIIPRDSKFKKNLSRTGTQNKVAYKTDMLFGMSREILNWGIMREEIGCISSAYHVFAVSEDIDSLYLELYIQANIDHFRDLIRPAAREGQGLDQQALMTKTLLLPPKDIISAYHDIADPVSKQNQNLKTENAALSTLRDTLLPKLMSGEITLP